MIKTLSNKLNRFKMDNQSLHKLLEEREEQRAADRRKKMITDYRFTESEMESFIEDFLFPLTLDNIETFEDKGYNRYSASNWSYENLDDNEKLSLHQAVEHCNDAVRSILRPKIQPELPN